MTLPVLNDKSGAFVQVHTAGTVEQLQVFGGRIQLADSLSPADGDWMVLPEGAIIQMTNNKWARKIDASASVQVSAI